MLNAQLQEFQKSLLGKIEQLLEEKGVIPPGSENFPAKMSTKMVAERKGVTSFTVLKNRHKWGLRKIGQNKDGLVFCGASVAKHINSQNKGGLTK